AQSHFVPCAKVALEGRRSGEWAAECACWIREFLSCIGLQRIEVDGCAVCPQERGFLDQLAMIPCGANLDAEPAPKASHNGRLNPTDSVIAPVDDAVSEQLEIQCADLSVIPVLLIDCGVPEQALVPPGRLPADLVSSEIIRCKGETGCVASMLTGLLLPIKP